MLIAQCHTSFHSHRNCPTSHMLKCNLNAHFLKLCHFLCAKCLLLCCMPLQKNMSLMQKLLSCLNKYWLHLQNDKLFLCKYELFQKKFKLILQYYKLVMQKCKLFMQISLLHSTKCKPLLQFYKCLCKKFKCLVQKSPLFMYYRVYLLQKLRLDKILLRTYLLFILLDEIFCEFLAKSLQLVEMFFELRKMFSHMFKNFRLLHAAKCYSLMHDGKSLFMVNNSRWRFL